MAFPMPLEQQIGCVVLFTGWFHRCIRLASDVCC